MTDEFGSGEHVLAPGGRVLAPPGVFWLRRACFGSGGRVMAPAGVSLVSWGTGPGLELWLGKERGVTGHIATIEYVNETRADVKYGQALYET